ncbi:C6 zinc finger domain protein [Penicillium chermesinum]|uniref:C6 zinc finger domain protein n=1 Tax=Penicillium chermesinum TaxID=63820 RepID=A0A9W9NQE5_9EURO|nr:C6 zinc finger domain protein [Penicillium chermesinum]KAJ5224081.1 C6 zinc finger domain protein [Penicillium chermesinum]
MVNRGRSGACITCKQRRVKCDEAKPKCQTCHRLGLRCDGYQTRYSNLKFRDQNYKFRGVRPTPVASDENRVLRPRALGAPDTSVSFFLQYYVGMGRDLGSARGFYEVLTPVYYSQTQESPLSLAVSAVASEVLSLWRGDPTCASQEMYTRAITRLRSTLQDRKNWGDPATLLAVLSLQMYENVAAVFDLRSGTSVHHDGALSLLPFAGSSPSDALTWTHLQRFILHSEICSALRQERPSHRIVSSWVEGEYSIAPSENPSPRLDAIGAAVAELQARFMQCSKQNVQMQNAP